MNENNMISGVNAEFLTMTRCEAYKLKFILWLSAVVLKFMVLVSKHLNDLKKDFNLERSLGFEKKILKTAFQSSDITR